MATLWARTPTLVKAFLGIIQVLVAIFLYAQVDRLLGTSFSMFAW